MSMLTMSMLTLYTNHPMTIIVLIMAFMIFNCMFLMSTFKMYWFSLIFMLIMMGGMLVSFIYMASLTASEKMNFKPSLLLIVMIFILPPTMFMNFTTTTNMKMMKNIYYSISSLNTVFCCYYLLLVLIFVTFLLTPIKGPIRMN